MRLRVQSALNFRTDAQFGLMPGAEMTFELGLLQDSSSARGTATLAPLLQSLGIDHREEQEGGKPVEDSVRSVVTEAQFAGQFGRRPFWRIVYPSQLGPDGVTEAVPQAAHLHLSRAAVLVGADTPDAMKKVTESLIALNSADTSGRVGCDPKREIGTLATCFVFRAHGLPVPLIPVRLQGSLAWVAVGTRLGDVLAHDKANLGLPFATPPDGSATTALWRFEMLGRSAPAGLRLLRRFPGGPARLDTTNTADTAALLRLPLVPGDDVTW
jgi:hypothetical protein